METPIFITGCARSGTSMVAGIINSLGIWGGSMSGPTEWNKKGMFENHYIRENIIKPLLRELGADELGQNPLPDMKKVNEFASDTLKIKKLRSEILSAMSNQGLIAGQQWFYKGAKMCLIWPIIHSAFPNAKWIIVRRSMDGIVSSCLRTVFMRKRSTKEEWEEWVQEHEKRFAEMDKNLNTQMLYSENIINNDFSELKLICQQYNILFNEEIIKKFVDTTLWHGSNK